MYYSGKVQLGEGKEGDFLLSKSMVNKCKVLCIVSVHVNSNTATAKALIRKVLGNKYLKCYFNMHVTVEKTIGFVKGV